MSSVRAEWKGMRRWYWLAPLASVSVSLLLINPAARAQPGPRELQTVEGKVRSSTTAPRGEVDGVVLEDGTIVHWPPHLEERFRALATPGERIRVRGRMETGPEGDSHLDVVSLTNLRTRASEENEDGPPPPPPGRRGPRGPRRPRELGFAGAEQKTVEGKVRDITTAPRGEVDGVVLEDGTVVHWPPHLEDRFRALAARGERIRVTGRMETGPEGDTHVEVVTLTNLRSGASRENEAVPPPPPPQRRDPRGESAPRPSDREQRLRLLEDQVEQLRRQIQRLRKDR